MNDVSVLSVILYIVAIGALTAPIIIMIVDTVKEYGGNDHSNKDIEPNWICLLYTSDAADE